MYTSLYMRADVSRFLIPGWMYAAMFLYVYIMKKNKQYCKHKPSLKAPVWRENKYLIILLKILVVGSLHFRQDFGESFESSRFKISSHFYTANNAF